MKTSTNGIETHYVVEGEGPWVVMSHSLACNLAMWDPTAKELAKRFKVVRYDTRGHGQSGAPAGAYTLDQLATDVKALMDTLGITSCHWVGLSMGGMIGQTFALKYPGIFRTMTLADTTSQYPADAKAIWDGRVKVAMEQGMDTLVQPTLERWFTEPFRKANPDMMKLVGGWIRNTPAAGYAGCCQALPQINVTARLKEIAAPTLVIVGEQDGGTPPAMARTIHENKPGSELVVIPSAAHISNMEQPAAFNQVLGAFLARHA